ncbi:hypothetical protein CC86DRAFT_404913 [Ophiobolus disseminans]|uniref:Uncharacterized protein n=1 Tax=Ophiobolus disseminans TaxID=1469910 RepID=A0A6A7A3J8_9PLEO|nr:hypothetical protein CC86DRAFT_404913 [Ophiobolus disseminans]
MQPATYSKHHPTLPSIPSQSTTPVPVNSSSSPWNPPTPVASLRRQFRLFTEEENARRAYRGEQPFCSPDGRERAFAKLMRLSRGEEPIHWTIDTRPDRYDEIEEQAIQEAQWYEVFKNRADEEGSASGKNEEAEDADTVMVDAATDEKKGDERKDSLQVGGAGGWRRLVGRVVGLNVHDEQKEEEKRGDHGSMAERFEDVDMEMKR